MTIQFAAGTTYSTRSVCDHETVISITVKSRTAKTIKTECGKTLRVSEYDGAELVKPWGSYSMAPIIMAKDGPLVAKASESVKDMLGGVEFKSLFSAEEQAEILAIVGKVCTPEAQPVSTAKVYDFAAYRSAGASK